MQRLWGELMLLLATIIIVKIIATTITKRCTSTSSRQIVLKGEVSIYLILILSIFVYSLLV